MIDKFTDEDLGDIYIRQSKRAKRCIARRRNNRVELTVPHIYSEKQIMEVFLKLKPRILNLPSSKRTLLYPTSVFQTCTFQVQIGVEAVNSIYATLRSGILSIICPFNTNFDDDMMQDLIYGYIEATMKAEAKRLLPQKVKELALKYDFYYASVKINKSRTRWGSCSYTKNINLSYYCMLLPQYLVDFVILHELCHTREMNHGINFWRLLDSVTNNRAKELTRELKAYSTHW